MVPPFSNRADVPIILTFDYCILFYGTFTLIGQMETIYTTYSKVINNNIQIHRLFWFHSPLLPESRLISFPIGTVMFYFPMFYTIYKRFTLGM